MRPNRGIIVTLDNKSMVDVDDDNKFNYTYTGKTVVMGEGIRCATFSDGKGNVFAQPWSVAGYFRRKGQKNINARLNNEQVREMVRAFVLDKKPVEELAVKYDITKGHCQDIVSGNAWAHITRNLIFQLRQGNTKEVAVTVNKPKPRNKVSAALIPFIRRDKEVYKMATSAIAIKYCLSKRQTQRILAGQAWK